jgi:predicted ArsR family transcriptional regulator
VSDELAGQVASVGSLAEPSRRELYLYVATQPDPVSREQAAEAVGLPLHSVKFHLDRLVDQGLLDVEFRRLSGRSGPGAGRPSKLYRRSAREVSVSLPERHYDLAGDMLAAAIDRSMRDSSPIAGAVRATAEGEGRRIAASALTGDAGATQTDAPAAHRDGDLAIVARVLERCGYEPRVLPGEVRLANCPFDRLAAKHAQLVCGMNLALISGVLDELRLQGLHADLDPRPGWCCVRIRN